MSMEGIVKKIRENRVPEILVKDMMTKKVYVLNDNENLDVAKLLMDSIHIRHIPIINKNDEFVGLLTHRDLLKLSVSSLADMDEEDQQKIHQSISLRDVMNTDVQTISQEAKLKNAIEQIINNKYGCLPVLEDLKLVGIITEADFVKLTYKFLDLLEDKSNFEKE